VLGASPQAYVDAFVGSAVLKDAVILHLLETPR